MPLPIALRIQGFFLGAALGELYSHGLLLPPAVINRATTAIPEINLPLTQQLCQWTLTGLQTSACFWTASVLPSTSWQSLYLNAAIFPLLYPGSPTELLQYCESLQQSSKRSETIESAIALSFAIALAIQTPSAFLTLLSKFPKSSHTNSLIAQMIGSVLRSPTDFPCSLQQMGQRSANIPFSLTLTGALSGSLNTITGFPLPWLATLSSQPCPDLLGKHTWLETIASLSHQCLAQWSGSLQPTSELSVAQVWNAVAIAPAHQLRPQTERSCFLETTLKLDCLNRFLIFL